jgi:hypothetical protein
MGQPSGTNSNREPPRERNKRRCYAEQAPKLLESNPVEVEREFPAEDNSPIEHIEPHVRPLSPLCEDWGAP